MHNDWLKLRSLCKTAWASAILWNFLQRGTVNYWMRGWNPTSLVRVLSISMVAQVYIHRCSGCIVAWEVSKCVSSNLDSGNVLLLRSMFIMSNPSSDILAAVLQRQRFFETSQEWFYKERLQEALCTWIQAINIRLKPRGRWYVGEHLQSNHHFGVRAPIFSRAQDD